MAKTEFAGGKSQRQTQSLLLTSRSLIRKLGPSGVARTIACPRSSGAIEGRLQRMLECVAADLRALNQSIPAGRAEMDAGIDAGVCVLPSRL